EPAEVRRLAAAIAVLGVELSGEAAVEWDEKRLLAIAERSEYADGVIALARYQRGTRRYDDALATLDRAAGMKTFGGESVHVEHVGMERVYSLVAAGRASDALAYARS